MFGIRRLQQRADQRVYRRGGSNYGYGRAVGNSEIAGVGGDRQNERGTGHDTAGNVAVGVFGQLQSVVLRIHRHLIGSGVLARKGRGEFFHICGKFVEMRYTDSVVYNDALAEYVGQIRKQVDVVCAGGFVVNAHYADGHYVAFQSGLSIKEQRELEVHDIGYIQYSLYRIIYLAAEYGVAVLAYHLVQNLEHETHVQQAFVAHRRDVLIVDPAEIFFEFDVGPAVLDAERLVFFQKRLLSNPNQSVLFRRLIEHVGNRFEYVGKRVNIAAGARFWIGHARGRGNFRFKRSRNGNAQRSEFLDQAVFRFFFVGQFENRVESQFEITYRRLKFHELRTGAGSTVAEVLNAQRKEYFERTERRARLDLKIQGLQIRSDVQSQRQEDSRQEVLCQRQGQSAVRKRQSDISVYDFVGGNVAFLVIRSVGNVARFAAAGERRNQRSDDFVGVRYHDVIESDDRGIDIKV